MHQGPDWEMLQFAGGNEQVIITADLDFTGPMSPGRPTAIATSTGSRLRVKLDFDA